MKSHIELIMNDGWYKTATQEEMRIALMHLEQEAINTFFNHIGETKKKALNDKFEECSDLCGWDNKPQGT